MLFSNPYNQILIDIEIPEGNQAKNLERRKR